MLSYRWLVQNLERRKRRYEDYERLEVSDDLKIHLFISEYNKKIRVWKVVPFDEDVKGLMILMVVNMTSYL